MIAAAVSWNQFARLDVRAVLDILIIAVLIYYVLKLLRGTRAIQMLVAIVLLVILYRAARWAQFEMVQWLLDTLLPYVAIALIVLVQPEIRRALDRFGRNITLSRFSSGSPASSYDDVVLAASYFSQNRMGALIAFEREVGLRIYVESGIPMISNQLGTRHRAAIGVTEESDAAVVVVSEQTGAISLAVGGAIEVGLSVEQLNERLGNIFRGLPAQQEL